MTPQLDLAAVEQWLYLLHGDCPGYSIISSPTNWTGRAVLTQSDTWPDDLLRYVQILDNQGQKGIYLRVTTVGEQPKPGRRGSDEHSVALPALWLDMDIAGPGHKPIKPTRDNPNPLPLPPDDFTCAEILSKTDLPEPTLWVHSGGGMYPYWFFKKPVILDSPDIIEQWSKWSANLHDRVYEAAKELGFHYGLGTHDMSRVLRIPGTVNRKVDGHPVLAQQVWAELGGHTFTSEELMFAPPVKPVVEKISVSDVSPGPTPPSTPSGSLGGLRPGDDFNQRGDVLGEVLLTEGWQIHSRRGAELFLTRPGKDRRDGHSASLGYENSPNLYVWSTDAGLPVQEPLSPFYLFTHYLHNGDYAEATRDLRRRGFGDPLPSLVGMMKLGDPTLSQRSTDFAAVMAEPGAAPQQPAMSPAPTPPSPDSNPLPSVPPSTPRQPEPLLAVHNVHGEGVAWVDMTDERQACIEVQHTLGTGNTSCAFWFNGKVVYVPSCDDGPVFQGTGKQLREGVYAFDSFGFRSFLYERFQWVRRDKDGTPRKVMPSVSNSASIHAYLKTGLGRGLRNLRDVVRRPIVRPDGTICDTPGYDEVTELVYWPDPNLRIPAVPEQPTDEQVKVARDTLAFMLTDFPFVSREDYNNYLGFLFTPLLFSVIDTPIKLGIIGAHQPGSGKTLLANILQEIHGGTLMPGLKNGGDEEIRKQVTANLRGAMNPICLWDNVSGRLDSATLDALLTSRSWRDRVLGQTQMIDTPNDRLWLITANNLQVGSDLTRRVTWSMINPNMPNPEYRTNFTIPDMMGWVKANRGVILWSLYTLIQAWTAKGQPTWCAQSDLFCGWVGAINGILKVAGIEGEFDSLASRQQAESSQATEWGEMFEAAYEQFGEGGWTIAELLDRVASNGGSTLPGSVLNMAKPLSMDILPIDVLSEFRAGNTTWVARTLGIRMASLVNSYCGGYQLIKAEKRTRKGIIWAVRPVATPNESSGQQASAAPAMPVDLADWTRRLQPRGQRGPAEDPLAAMMATLEAHAQRNGHTRWQPEPGGSAPERSSGPSEPAAEPSHPSASLGQGSEVVEPQGHEYHQPGHPDPVT